RREHHEVDGAERVLHLAAQPGAVLGRAEVDGGERTATGFLDQLGEGFLAAGRGEHLGAGLDREARERPTDPGGRADHQHPSSLQRRTVHGGSSPPAALSDAIYDLAAMATNATYRVIQCATGGIGQI